MSENYDKIAAGLNGLYEESLRYKAKAEKLEQQNSKLREALKFYAHQNSWRRINHDARNIVEDDGELLEDRTWSTGGKCARNALKECES